MPIDLQLESGEELAEQPGSVLSNAITSRTDIVSHFGSPVVTSPPKQNSLVAARSEAVASAEVLTSVVTGWAVDTVSTESEGPVMASTFEAVTSVGKVGSNALDLSTAATRSASFATGFDASKLLWHGVLRATSTAVARSESLATEIKATTSMWPGVSGEGSTVLASLTASLTASSYCKACLGTPEGEATFFGVEISLAGGTARFSVSGMISFAEREPFFGVVSAGSFAEAVEDSEFDLALIRTSELGASTSLVIAPAADGAGDLVVQTAVGGTFGVTGVDLARTTRAEDGEVIARPIDVTSSEVIGFGSAVASLTGDID